MDLFACTKSQEAPVLGHRARSETDHLGRRSEIQKSVDSRLRLQCIRLRVDRKSRHAATPDAAQGNRFSAPWRPLAGPKKNSELAICSRMQSANVRCCSHNSNFSGE
jgi:hypothetical protein